MSTTRDIVIFAAGAFAAATAIAAFELPRHRFAIDILSSAAAKDVLGSDRWSYRNRGSSAALGKATMMWQIERSGNAGAAGVSDADVGPSGGGRGTGGGTAIANYNDIDVFFAEDSKGSVSIVTDQDSTGDQTTRSTDMINIIDQVNTGASGETSGQ